MSTVSPPLAGSTEKALNFKIGHEFNQLRDMATRYVVEQESAANSRALGLHRGYQHLQAVLVPEMLDRVITYCLDLELRDADLITRKIKAAFVPQLKALGQSLGISFQTPSTGMTMREISTFREWVDGYCAINIPPRVHIAVERRRHMDPPPEPPQKDEPVGAIYNITGPTQINNSSPGSFQMNTGEPNLREPSPLPSKRTGFWKNIERLCWIAGIVGTIFVILEFISHRKAEPRAEPAPPVSTPVVSRPPPTERLRAIPEPPAPVGRKAAPPQPHPEEKRVSPMKDDDPKPTIKIVGPAQINNHSPGSIQINQTPPPDPTPPKVDAFLATSPNGELVTAIQTDNRVPFYANWRIVTENDQIVSPIMVTRGEEIHPQVAGQRTLYKQEIHRDAVTGGYIELRLRYSSIYAAQLGNPAELSGYLVRRYRIDDRGVSPLDPNERHTP